MLVYIAQNGKTLELDVQPNTRVDALQQALASMADIPVDQQIVMCEGRRLDGTAALAAYQLPWDEQRHTKDVFLYNRSHLRSGAAPQNLETLAALTIEVPPPSSINYDSHLLQISSSPLYRALVDYERHFRHHISEAEVYLDATQQRAHIAEQLISEQRVQQMAIEAAVVNVEGHYRYIRDMYNEFMARYESQYTSQHQLLERFPSDLEYLGAMQLHLAAQTAEYRRLLDLLPDQRLRSWAEYCRKTHIQFADKVRELEKLYTLLRSDVESLLMQAPAQLYIDKIREQLGHHKQLLDEQVTIRNALHGDFHCVQMKVEEWARLMAHSAANNTATGSGVDLEELRAMEEMNQVHLNDLLPRVRQMYAHLEDFTQQCMRDKNAMTVHLCEQLQTISSQQSKIRDMRNKLAAFKEVATKQSEAFAQLSLVRQLPAAYKQCLAECVRRRAFGELYSGQAAQLAEKMGRIRDKEVAKREAFKKAVERLIPPPVLANMGLLSQPPHCEVNVPTGDAHLLKVTLEDVRRFSNEIPSSPRAGAVAELLLMPSIPEVASHEETDAEAAAMEEYAGTQELELENAKLRAEVAHFLARESEPSGSMSSAHGTDRPAAGTTGASTEGTTVWQEAVQQKQAYIDKLQDQMKEWRRMCHAYEQRISQLESRRLTDSKQAQTDVPPLQTTTTTTTLSTATSTPFSSPHAHTTTLTPPPTHPAPMTPINPLHDQPPESPTHSKPTPQRDTTTSLTQAPGPLPNTPSGSLDPLSGQLVSASQQLGDPLSASIIPLDPPSPPPTSQCPAPAAVASQPSRGLSEPLIVEPSLGLPSHHPVSTSSQPVPQPDQKPQSGVSDARSNNAWARLSAMYEGRAPEEQAPPAASTQHDTSLKEPNASVVSAGSGETSEEGGSVATEFTFGGASSPSSGAGVLAEAVTSQQGQGTGVSGEELQDLGAQQQAEAVTDEQGQGTGVSGEEPQGLGPQQQATRIGGVDQDLESAGVGLAGQEEGRGESTAVQEGTAVQEVEVQAGSGVAPTAEGTVAVPEDVEVQVPSPPASDDTIPSQAHGTQPEKQ